MSLGLAGAWLWETFGGKVTERASQRGGDAARALWQRLNWQRAAEQYRGEMQRLYNRMQIIGMTEAVALADVFTDVYLLDKPSAWRRHNIEELTRLQELEQAAHDQQLVRHDAVAFVQRNERLFLLGKSGAGKTTLLKHLVLRATGGDIDAVPIFVGLKAWSDSRPTLMAFLIQQFTICAFPDAQPFIEHILTDGRALVLFDGLDEVNPEDKARERIIREVRDFAPYTYTDFILGSLSSVPPPLVPPAFTYDNGNGLFDYIPIGAPGTLDPQIHAIKGTYPNLDPSESITITLRVRLDNQIPTNVLSVINNALFEGEGIPLTTAVVVSPINQVDLLIHKDDGRTVVEPGQQITYTLTYTNAGPGIAHNAVMTDTLPPSAINVSSPTVPGVITPTIEPDRIIFQLGTLPAGYTRQTTITLTLGPGTVDPVVNSVTCWTHTFTAESKPCSSSAISARSALAGAAVLDWVRFLVVPTSGASPQA